MRPTHGAGTGAAQLNEVEDVGEVIAASVEQWFGDPDNRALIERLRKAVRAQRLDVEVFPELHSNHP